ncbi:hypothetical protein ACP8HI_13550 [Paenibacillus sp. FA6]|uniref:hypothetical protein n=1 Tax=Paenibacillus sp. FA6 TaxID=3413029 RepID=UPI003F657EDD
MKKLKSTSLILLGVILGLGLSFSPQIYAATSGLLGSTVSGIFTIEQNGKKIADSAIINGSAYVPVRLMAEATGTLLTVEGKVITLGKSGMTQLTSEEFEIETAKVNKLNADKRTLEIKIKNKKEEIASAEYNIQNAQKRIDVYNEVPLQNGEIRGDVQTEIDRYQAEINSDNDRLVIANKELVDLETQLAELIK